MLCKKCLWSCFVIALTLTCVFGEILVTCGRNRKREKRNKPFCRSKAIKELPRPEENETTAIRPIFRTANWYNFQKRKHKYMDLAINLTWSQSGDTASMVKGYVLLINPLRASRPTMYQISFDSKITSKNRTILLNYHCSRRDLIRPGSSYSFTILSMPIFHEKLNVNKAASGIYIPGCCENNSEISKLHYCHKKDCEENKIQYKTADTDHEEQFSQDIHRELTSDSPALLAAVISICLFLFTGCFMLGRFVFGGKSNICKISQCTDKIDCLLILTSSNDENACYHDAANRLATMLGDDNPFNLWKCREIGDPRIWTAQKLKLCSHVLLICTPQSKRSYDHFFYETQHIDPFLLTMHAYSKNTHRSEILPKLIIVYFDYKKEFCIPKHLRKYICFQLMEEFDSFCNYLRGRTTMNVFGNSVDGLRRSIEIARSSQTISAKCEHFSTPTLDKEELSLARSHSYKNLANTSLLTTGIKSLVSGNDQTTTIFSTPAESCVSPGTKSEIINSDSFQQDSGIY